MTHEKNEQIELLQKRFATVGVDRRTVMKMVSAAAGAAALGGFVGELPGRQPQAAAAPEVTPDTTFYSYELFDDPVSFDWNQNLYCNAQTQVNASVLKIKLAMAIIGISSIHLLKTFIEAGYLGREGAKFTEAGIMWQTIIHIVFILSAVGIAYVDKLSHPPVAHGSEKSKEHA